VVHVRQQARVVRRHLHQRRAARGRRLQADSGTRTRARARQRRRGTARHARHARTHAQGPAAAAARRVPTPALMQAHRAPCHAATHHTGEHGAHLDIEAHAARAAVRQRCKVRREHSIRVFRSVRHTRFRHAQRGAGDAAVRGAAAQERLGVVKRVQRSGSSCGGAASRPGGGPVTRGFCRHNEKLSCVHNEAHLWTAAAPQGSAARAAAARWRRRAAVARERDVWPSWRLQPCAARN
jgi:hypothetical protein